MNNTEVSNEDIAVMVEKLKRKRECGRIRAQKGMTYIKMF